MPRSTAISSRVMIAGVCLVLVAPTTSVAATTARTAPAEGSAVGMADPSAGRLGGHARPLSSRTGPGSGSLAAQRTAEARRAADLVAHSGNLRRIPTTQRPKIRWWWPVGGLDKAEIRAELVAMKRAGFGGVEQVLLHNPNEWGTPAFTESLRFALTTATSLDLTFDVTLGPAWPISSPTVSDVSREASMQDLTYGSVDVVGPMPYVGPVPDLPPAMTELHRRLIGVVGVKILSQTGTEVVVEPGSAVDLTRTVGPSGLLTWTPPGPGRWRLYGFWMRPTMQTNRGGGADGPLVVDHYGRRGIDLALADFDRLVFSRARAAFRRNGGDVFEDSYEVTHGAQTPGPIPTSTSPQSTISWTRRLTEEFQTRRGYSVARLLPGLFDEISFPGGKDVRLERDLRATMTELLVDRHLRPMAVWARERGLHLRGQAYQAALGSVGVDDVTQLARALPKPDVETLGFGDPVQDPAPNAGLQLVPPGSPTSRLVLDRYRQVVSGAHLSGAREVSNEWGAAYGGDYLINPGDLKTWADHSLASGVSRMVLHGFSYRDHTTPVTGMGASGWSVPGPGPDWLGWCAWCNVAGYSGFSDSYNQAWPQWKAMPRLNDYLARAGMAVSTGRPRVDLTVLNDRSRINDAASLISPPFDPAGTPEDAFRRALSSRGFTWDSIGMRDLVLTGAVRGGRLLPDGPAYKAVVVQDQPAMTAATAERLVRLARSGLPVVVMGRVADAGMGYWQARREDRRVRTAMATLRRLAAARFVAKPAGVLEALRSLGVHPDIAGRRAGDVVPSHRRTASGDVWFLHNNSSTPVASTISFRTTGVPSAVDLWSGEVTPLGSYVWDKSTGTVPVRIEVDGTAVVLFDRRGRHTSTVTRTDADEVLRAGDDLVVRDGRGGRVRVVLSDGRRVILRLPRVPGPRKIAGPWRLDVATVSPSGDRRVRIELDRLDTWDRIPELQGASGTGIYRTTVRVSRRALARDRGTRLSLGAFDGAARVWVNDRQVDIASVPGAHRADITRLLREGTNRIRIELTTNLNNAVRTHAQTGAPGYTKYVLRPEHQYGLVGPVVLEHYAQAVVPRP